MYKYKDNSGASPCRRLYIRNHNGSGRIRAFCYGRQAPLHYNLQLGTDEGLVSAVLTLGSKRFCSQFDDYKGRNGANGRSFYGRDAPTPEACPIPAPPPSFGLHHFNRADFDGDGEPDYALWRPADGTWQIEPSSDGPFSVQLGEHSDIPVPGDYDADGRTDFAVWRPATGTWHVLTSPNGDPYTVELGGPGDSPVPADYDGDDQTDYAVWRNGGWTVKLDVDEPPYTVSIASGPSSIPVPGDYNGDASVDYAVWDPDDATWHYRIDPASGEVLDHVFPSEPHEGSVPVPADYDGDGTTDFAVWTPETGLWEILSSFDSTETTITWGEAGDLPIPGDYDADKRVDYALWRPSEGYWHIMTSTGEFGAVAFGAFGDVPLAGGDVIEPEDPEEDDPLFLQQVLAASAATASADEPVDRELRRAKRKMRKLGRRAQRLGNRARKTLEEDVQSMGYDTYSLANNTSTVPIITGGEAMVGLTALQLVPPSGQATCGPMTEPCRFGFQLPRIDMAMAAVHPALEPLGHSHQAALLLTPEQELFLQNVDDFLTAAKSFPVPGAILMDILASATEAALTINKPERLLQLENIGSKSVQLADIIARQSGDEVAAALTGALRKKITKTLSVFAMVEYVSEVYGFAAQDPVNRSCLLIYPQVLTCDPGIYDEYMEYMGVTETYSNGRNPKPERKIDNIFRPRGCADVGCRNWAYDCACDEDCVLRGDCCKDACSECTYCSCRHTACLIYGECEAIGNGGCFCDKRCPLRGDCCADSCETKGACDCKQTGCLGYTISGCCCSRTGGCGRRQHCADFEDACTASAPQQSNPVSLAGPIGISGTILEPTDLSAVACFPGGDHCLIGTDERAFVQTIHKTAPNQFAIGETISFPGFDEIDIESISRHDNQFDIFGSYGMGKKRCDYQPSRYTHLRIHLDPTTGQLDPSMPIESFDHIPMFRDHPVLGPYFGLCLQDNGINIEGVAFKDGRFFFGFRGPLLGRKAIILEDVAGLPVHWLDLDGLGIRELTATDNGMLIVAGAAHPDVEADFALYWWDMKQDAFKLSGLNGMSGKAEGLAVLEETEDEMDVMLLQDGPAGGDPKRYSISKPGGVFEGLGSAHLALGFGHTCVAAYWTGFLQTVSCWGDNDSFQTGVETAGPVLDRGNLVQYRERKNGDPQLLQGIKKVDAGDSHSCALDNQGRVICWGSNHVGQLGTELFLGDATPIGIVVDDRVSDLAIAASTTCVLKKSGKVRCWGSNERSELGSASSVSDTHKHKVVRTKNPYKEHLTDVLEISSQSGTFCALRDTGAVFCWGSNEYRQAGAGEESSSGPTAGQVSGPNECSGGVPCVRLARKVSDLSDAVSVYSTWNLGCAAVDIDGDKVGDELDCWGAIPGRVSPPFTSKVPIEVDGPIGFPKALQSTNTDLGVHLLLEDGTVYLLGYELTASELQFDEPVTALGVGADQFCTATADELTCDAIDGAW